MRQSEKEGILLESGTNEIEVMKFTVMGEFYGINVAKVQEIIMSERVKPGEGFAECRPSWYGGGHWQRGTGRAPGNSGKRRRKSEAEGRGLETV